MMISPLRGLLLAEHPLSDSLRPPSLERLQGRQRATTSLLSKKHPAGVGAAPFLAHRRAVPRSCRESRRAGRRQEFLLSNHTLHFME